MKVAQRKLLMGGLLAAFCGQTALVYLDDTAASFPTLSPPAVRGRQIWHDYNCQACHQIHGFGGFLGPDLTNAGPRLTTERLQQVLTVGTGQMPAFHLSETQIEEVSEFLLELNQMGVGVARRDPPIEPSLVFAAVEQCFVATEPAAAVERGFRLFQKNCSVCHVPLQSTPLGLQTAPDLTTAVERLDDAALRTTIVEGRLDRGMPAWKLPAADIDDLIAFVRWSHEDREALVEELGSAVRSEPSSLPWWEYR